MQIHLLILSNFFACLSAPYKIYNYKHHDNMVVLTLLKITQEILECLFSAPYKIYNYKHHDNMVVLTLLKITQEILKDVINIQNIFLLV